MSMLQGPEHWNGAPGRPDHLKLFRGMHNDDLIADADSPIWQDVAARHPDAPPELQEEYYAGQAEIDFQDVPVDIIGSNHPDAAKVFNFFFERGAFDSDISR